MDGATLSLLLKELKLPTMVRMWEDLSIEASEKGWSAPRYLSKLCDYELTERERGRLSKWLSESQLPRSKSLESFDFSLIPSLNKEHINGLAKGDIWIKDGMNLLIFGPSGVGKSHLAAGIGQGLIESGYRVLFIRTTELLQKLLLAKQEHTLKSTLNRLDKYECLILDDFGYVKKSEMETSLLFELIAERYERRSLLITCNQPFKEWDQIFDDKRMAVAAIDRLIHHATLLELSAESYRKRLASSRLEVTYNKESKGEEA